MKDREKFEWISYLWPFSLLFVFSFCGWASTGLGAPAAWTIVFGTFLFGGLIGLSYRLAYLRGKYGSWEAAKNAKD